MNERERLQRRWIEGARRQQAPPADAVIRMRRGLATRIAADEPAPAWEVPPSSAGPRIGPWLAGGGILLVAAALLVWLSGSSKPLRTMAEASQAASYDAKDGESAYAAQRGKQGRAAVAKPSHDEVAVIHDEVVDPNGEGRESTSDKGEPPIARRVRPQQDPVSSPGSGDPVAEAKPPPLQRPSSKALPSAQPKVDEQSALDVAGEAALLRSATAAIEAEEWTRAGKALSDYTRRYPRGVLSPEATALRVVVDCGRGEPRATKAAAEFLRKHPASPVRERIRRACATEPNP